MVLITKNNKWIGLGILNLCSSLCLVSLALISKLILDAAQQQDTKQVLFYCIFLLGMVVLGVGFKLIENFLYVRFSIARELELKHLLLERRVYLEFDSVTPHTAILMQNYTADINHILTGELEVLPSIFYQAGRFICALVVVAILDWRLLLILLGVALIGLLFARIYGLRMKKLHQNVLEQDGRMNAFFQETVENVVLVQAYGAQQSFLKTYDDQASNARYARKKKFHFQLMATNLMVLASNILYAGCIGYGGYAIAMNWISYGSLLAITQLIQHLQTPILSISGLINRYSLAKTSYERLNKSLEGTMIESKEIKSFTKLIASDLCFSYPDKPIIQNLSFEIEAGTIVRIAGESGIGKTTLCMLLMDFLKPEAGCIEVYSGEQKIEGNRASLFAYVAQDNILFSSTVRKNFELLAGVSEEKMVEALRFACLEDEIESLDTPLNERGKGLSIGQIQRLAIAIAYAKDRPIFLLDEFSSALDEENAAQIAKHLKESHKTIIYISHKTEQLVTDQSIHL